MSAQRIAAKKKAVKKEIKKLVKSAKAPSLSKKKRTLKSPVKTSPSFAKKSVAKISLVVKGLRKTIKPLAVKPVKEKKVITHAEDKGEY